jgi:NADH dehydrogenase
MILVTGGTGFVGQTLIRQLVTLGKPVRILLRPSATSPNLPKGIPVEVAVCSLRDERGLRAALKGVDTVYHLAGSERMGTKADLTGVDVEGSAAIVDAATQSGVERFFYMSHLGADRSSAYPVLKAKALAESSIIRSGINYTIFRSAVLFGRGDQFTTSLVRLIRNLPLIFLMPGDGQAMIQPLWVEDLATCMILAIDDPKTENQVLEVGGCETLSFRQVVEVLMATINVKRSIINVMPAYLRMFGLYIESTSRTLPISLYWLDYLASDRTCALDVLPRKFGLMPARFHQELGYLASLPQNRSADRARRPVRQKR